MTEIDFEYFERTLHERRTYRCHRELAASQYEWMRTWDKTAGYQVTGNTEGPHADFTVTGTHRMAAGNPLGVARINERFNITLPADFDAFYRRWDGGVLLFSDNYPLLSVEQMVEVNMEFAEIANWDQRTPLRLIRFCSLYNDDYLCLRLGDDEG